MFTETNSWFYIACLFISVMFDHEDKIILDRETFKALAADTRVNILKELMERRKTLSELSRCLCMSVSAVKEHLEVLCSSGLIIQRDEGHKWKYYELTEKGKCVLQPQRKSIWVALGLSSVALVGSVLSLGSKLNFGKVLSGEDGGPVMMASDSAVRSKDAIGGGAEEVFMNVAAEASSDVVSVEEGVGYLDYFVDGKLPLAEMITVIVIAAAIVVLLRYIKR